MTTTMCRVMNPLLNFGANGFMFNQLIAGDTEFKVDPETNFWGTGDTEKLEKLFSKMQKKLVADMQDLRYNTDIILFYVNPTDMCALIVPTAIYLRN